MTRNNPVGRLRQCARTTPVTYNEYTNLTKNTDFRRPDYTTEQFVTNKRFYRVNVEIYFSKNHPFNIPPSVLRFVENRRHASHVIFRLGILDQPTQQQSHRRHPSPAGSPGTQHVIHERRTAPTEG